MAGTTEDLPARDNPHGWLPDTATLDFVGALADLAWFRVDAERNVVAVSPAMERMTGFAAAEVLGRPCIHLSRCEECLKGCGVFEAGEVRDHRLVLYRADGSEVEVVKAGSVLRDADGEVAGAVEILRPWKGRDEGIPPCPGTAAGAEAARIARALRETRYRRKDAAARLGMSRTTLWRKMREYGL